MSSTLSSQSESGKNSGGVVKNMLCAPVTYSLAPTSSSVVTYGPVWSEAQKSDNLSFKTDNLLPNWQSSSQLARWTSP